MKNVDYFKVQVNYSGSFDDYEEKDWRAKAQVQAERTDPYDHTDLLDDDTAFKEDGCMWIRNIYPCNKIAEVSWAYIREEA